MAHKQNISVAMCTYNGEEYLEEQLDSILNQSRSPDEIVICDDHSTDGTWSLLKEYQRRHAPKMRLFRNDTNLGSAKNFEKAIGLCTGNLIALSDQDDVWRQDKLDKLARRLEADSNLVLVFSNAARIDAAGNVLTPDLWRVVGLNEPAKDWIRTGQALRAFLHRPVVSGCTMMFRAALRAVCLPIGEPLMHDHWISLIAAANSRVGFVDEELVGYRQHHTNEIGARRLSLKQQFHRSRRLGVAECAQEKAGLEKVLDRLQDANHDQLSLIRQKISFLEFRVWLWSNEASRLRKAHLLVREALRGTYGRWGNGTRTLGKDAAMLLGVYEATM